MPRPTALPHTFAAVCLFRRPLRQPDAVECLERTSYRPGATLQYVRVNHCRLQVRMPEQFLDRPDVCALLQQMRREAVAPCVTRRSFRYARSQHRLLHPALHGGLVEMMPPPFAGLGIGIDRLELTRCDGHPTSPTLGAEVFNEQITTQQQGVETTGAARV